MPSRTHPFVNNQYYHIYNRGSEKRNIFRGNWDYKRFYKAIKYYQLEGPKPKLSTYLKFKRANLQNNKKIVDIICYCLMPNHFHFLLRQNRENGITEFISKLTNSYTKFYNLKYDRIGPLFQGEFKSVLVESEEQLLHLSRYIHLNPLASFLIKDLNNFQWSSYKEYSENLENICSKEVILNFFTKNNDFHQFVLDQADYAQQLELIKHQLIDFDKT